MNDLAPPEALARLLGRDSVFESTGHHTSRAAGNVVKVLGWYDNEYEYASRLAELAAKVSAACRPWWGGPDAQSSMRSQS
ncbi:MAG: hypothetical protein ACYCST_05665 [Acidimicrobiales bacterium]